ncbi:MAG: TRAP transporter small permease [Gammaproteobacteria bacterium]|nr:TRAP transporter small permease [Gammaproteobacteria bacterium]
MDGLLQRIVAALGRVNGPLGRAGRGVAALLLAVMLALALAQIVARGLFDFSLDWAEELARVALVWLVLLVAPQAYRSGAHVAIVSFANALPPRLLALVSLFLNALVLWILLVLFRESFGFWRRGLEITAATMDVKMAWIYAVVPVAFFALILVGVELLLRMLLQLRGAPSGIAMEGAMPAVAGD